MTSRPSGIFRDASARRDPVGRFDWRYSVVTAPATEPVTLSEAKLFAKVDISVDDALIAALIVTARQAVEKETGRALITQTIDANLDYVPASNKFKFSYRPIQSITHIKSVFEDGTEEEITTADTTLDGQNAMLGIHSTANNVTSDSSFNAFQVRYVAGYGDAADVPEWAKSAIKQLVSHWYEHREAVNEGTYNITPFGVQLLIDQNKVAFL